MAQLFTIDKACYDSPYEAFPSDEGIVFDKPIPRLKHSSSSDVGLIAIPFHRMIYSISVDDYYQGWYLYSDKIEDDSDILGIAEAMQLCLLDDADDDLAFQHCFAVWLTQFVHLASMKDAAVADQNIPEERLRAMTNAWQAMSHDFTELADAIGQETQEFLEEIRSGSVTFNKEKLTGWIPPFAM